MRTAWRFAQKESVTNRGRAEKGDGIPVSGTHCRQSTDGPLGCHRRRTRGRVLSYVFRSQSELEKASF